MNKLKYLGYTITFQEVPDEVALTINISGCPHRCEGCHSQYLWLYEGDYISDDLVGLIEKYKGLITCVCFMGGDQNQKELTDLLIKVRQYGLKTALYTGVNFLTDLHIRVLGNLDYCKIGSYSQHLGGLNSQNTNQKMLMWDWQQGTWHDITYKFWKEDKANGKSNS